ncbi:ribokinase [Mesoplasma florum L1]|uniref:Ribokinase n=1 Tax=Mesoplasma florum (strain ATCC 33453 / NBRC 100688 / NCTC 11704 / L1) TaxID=265311 RepID=Q6F0H5_MESFL|nr:ribokinase [Mesoplasma florum]AAT75998.1 ribokinase [Mesoplasma florum L1]ATI74287.1 ribokinase [Mesoplasma florum]AVN59245.1 ribokinase [Mesoplasma florum]
MKKILTMGSIGVDHVFNVDKLPNKGQSIISKNFNIFFGGKGANQAVAAAKLGADVKYIGHVGNDDAGLHAIENLVKNKIDASYIKKINNINTQVANIIVDDKGDNLLIVDTGANFTFLKDEINEYKELIDHSDILLTQLETNLEFVEDFINYGHSKNKLIILNPGPAKVISNKIIEKCDFITPNESEICILLGKEYTENYELLKKYAYELWDINKKNVIVTLGENGSIWIDEKGELHKFEAYKVKAVDATACGDTFMGGISAYLAQDKTIEEAIKFATAAASLAVTKMGAQSSLPELKEVHEFIKKNG